MNSHAATTLTPKNRESIQSAVEPLKGLGRRQAWILPWALLLFYVVYTVKDASKYGGFEQYILISDFTHIIMGAEIIASGDGANLYDLETQRTVQQLVVGEYYFLRPGDLMPFNHLPFEPLLIFPFLGLPVWLIFGVWSLVAAAALALSIWLLQKAHPLPRAALPIIVPLIASYHPVFRSFIQGQNCTFVLLGICLSYWSLKNERPWLAGAGMALVTLKPQVIPVVLLLAFAYKHWRAIGAYAAIMCGAAAACVPFLGWEWPFRYAQFLIDVANWTFNPVINPAVMHNLRGFATNTAGLISPALVTPALVLLSLGALGLLVGAYMALRRETGTRGWVLLSNSRTPQFWALGIIVGMLVAPHLHPQDLTLLVFPAWLVLHRLQSGVLADEQSRKRWALLLWAGYVSVPLFFLTSGDSKIGVVTSVALMIYAAWSFYRETAGRGAAARPNPGWLKTPQSESISTP
jgi:hypothetical protein